MDAKIDVRPVDRVERADNIVALQDDAISSMDKVAKRAVDYFVARPCDDLDSLPVGRGDDAIVGKQEEQVVPQPLYRFAYAGRKVIGHRGLMEARCITLRCVHERQPRRRTAGRPVFR